jgi:hypothetical protein
MNQMLDKFYGEPLDLRLLQWHISCMRCWLNFVIRNCTGLTDRLLREYLVKRISIIAYRSDMFMRRQGSSRLGSQAR